MGLWKKTFRGSDCVFLLCILVIIIFAQGDTNSNDAAALNAIASQWKNTPSNWVGFDPCGAKWVGIACNNSNNRVISITLSSIGLKGTLSGGDIQNLSELQALDLSYNPGLTGPLPASIGNLDQLINLILVGCSFSGGIPAEIGKLSNLVFLSLNSNKFSGSIPPTIGNLTKLYWLDLADNRLTGTIPVSDATNPGLDLLTHTKHFHFGINQLSGLIPSKLFSPNMTLIHVLFDNNNLTGSIPSTLGLVKTLEVLRLDKNSLTGPVPANLNNLTRLSEIHLANNELNGPLPDLTGMNSLNFVDMSNNSFDLSDVPLWFSSLPSLTSLYLEYLKIGGELPQTLFSNSPLQTLRLRDNRFNGTLNISTEYSNQLQLIDLTNNQIGSIIIGGGYSKQLILIGNPVCNQGNNLQYCKMTVFAPPSYNTSKKCATLPPICPSGQILSPNCQCAYPYTGTLFFRSPSFSDLSNDSYYAILEQGLRETFLKYQLPVDSISLQNVFVDSNNNLEMSLGVFPYNKAYFSEFDVTGIGFILSNQTYKPPSTFGPYYFLGQQYETITAVAPTSEAKKSNNLPIIIGVAAGGALLLVSICICILIIRRRKTARSHEEKSQSFASWDPKSSSSIPQLKGARMFTFEEVKNCTNNFSETNEIGAGGYGKVYRGTLGTRQLVAVKRAQVGSSQGSNEFRTEIELLSRVHHKNLVSLVGFCFDKGEQMLIYEYVPNGTLRDSLLGKSGVHLDWRWRLRVALGAAKGIAYLHELADPPIVHRDIKSSNVLLDENLNAKVADFGLSKSLGVDGRGQITTQVKGTMGYLDPEYYMTQQLTDKSDVYSFGVLLLELITGKKPLERGRYIIREVKSLLDRSKELYNLQSLLDPSLGLTSSVGGSCERYVSLALQCVDEQSAERPSMSEAVNEIEKIMQQAGVNPGSASNSLSFVGSTGSTPVRHPYGDDVPFAYSGDESHP